MAAFIETAKPAVALERKDISVFKYPGRHAFNIIGINIFHKEAFCIISQPLAWQGPGRNGSPLENLPDLFGQRIECKRFLQKCRAFLDNPLVGDNIGRVSGHVNCLYLRIQRLESLF